MLDNICICKICGEELKTMHHLQKHNITSEEYYKKYLKENNEGYCLCCNKETKYISLNKGYRQFCSTRCNIIYNKLSAKCGENNVSKNDSVRNKISIVRKEQLKTNENLKQILINNISNEKSRNKATKNMKETKNSSVFKEKCANKLSLKYKNNGYTFEIISTNDKEKVCKCLKCNQIFTIKSNLFYVRKRLNEEICLNCNPIIKNFSRKEKTLLSYIKTVYSGIIIENDTNELKGKELDIWLPEKRVAFEFDGSYWHRDERCFEKQLKDKNFKEETIKIHERDELKNKLCQENNIKLVRIKEFDWDNNRTNIKQHIMEILYD